MRIFDLTHVIEEDMPVFPGTDKPVLNNACTLEEHGFREKLITMYSHTGTHMDAPAHMVQGTCLDEFAIDKYIGRLVVIEANEYEVTLETLMEYEEEIKESDFVLLKTGWDKKWGSEEYFHSFPAISKKAAEYLTGFNLKGFGTDAISVDHMENKDFSVHHVLLESNFVLVENMKNLEMLETGDVLSVLPLHIKEGDGSPVRAVAIRL